MDETLSLFRSWFNKSLRIKSRPERLAGIPGSVVLREIMARTRFIEWMVERLPDPRKGDRINSTPAASNRSVRTKLSPHLEMRPALSTSPD